MYGEKKMEELMAYYHRRRHIQKTLHAYFFPDFYLDSLGGLGIQFVLHFSLVRIKIWKEACDLLLSHKSFTFYDGTFFFIAIFVSNLLISLRRTFMN